MNTHNNIAKLVLQIPYDRLVLALALMITVTALADGTREIISDLGLYSGDPPNSTRLDIYEWADRDLDNIDVNAELKGDPATPEGLKVVSAQVKTNWGGWGIFHVAPNNSSVVEEYDYSGFDTLSFSLKSTNQLLVEIEFASETGLIRKSGFTVPSTTNTWKEIVVSLSSLSPPVNLSRIRGPFLITATTLGGPKTWYVDHIRWTKPVAKIEIFPPTAKVNPGSHIQFTVEGKTSSGEIVLVNSLFVVPLSLGTLDPTPSKASMSSVLTAGINLGEFNVNSRLNLQGVTLLQATSVVQVTSENLYTKFVLISETTPASITLDADSKLFAFSGGGAASPVLDTVTTEFIEGTNSLSTTVAQSGVSSFSGWTIQWGNVGSPDSETQNLSGFYDGYLRFAVKAPPELQGSLFVGIRSGNVPPGKEISLVSLDDYISFNSQWNEVRIPIKLFAKSRPWADLSRIKNLFTLSVIGDTAGPRTFFIDDIYWETGRSDIPLVLTALDYRQHDNTFKFKLDGPAGSPFVLESSTNLATWIPIHTNLLNAGTFEYVQTNANNEPILFFRAKRL